MDPVAELIAKTYRLEDDTAASVHWKDRETQVMRLEMVSRAIWHGPEADFSILDAGCGLGALRVFARQRWPAASYTGADIVEEFIARCRSDFPRDTFLVADMLEITGQFDYCVVSGAFNEIPEGIRTEDFADWILVRVARLYELCRCAVVFNVIADLAIRWRNPRNYYADPAALMAALSRCSRFVSFWHDYPLYEMTVAVYRPEFVRDRFGGRGDWR